MPVSPAEAKDTLRDISTTAQASSTFYGYRKAAPHLLVWGVIWFIGYGAGYFHPAWTLVWPVLVIVGVIASFWIGRRTGKTESTRGDWRYAATSLTVFLFIAAIFSIMPPQSDAQAGAFFPILVALFYSLIGIWRRGVRMIVAGAAVAALTLGGYFWLPQIFLLWMAVVGGGALILGGLWLRSA
jgi:hypothetical protein